MEKSYIYKNLMSYSLEQKLSNKEIQMTLSVREKSTSKMYSCVLSEQNLSRELSNKFKTIEELFQLFETENNFQINPIEGSVHLILRKIMNNQFIEQKMKIELRKNYENYHEQTLLSEEFEELKKQKEQLLSQNRQLALANMTLKISSNENIRIKEEESSNSDQPQLLPFLQISYEKEDNFKKNFEEKFLKFKQKYQSWKKTFDIEIQKLEREKEKIRLAKGSSFLGELKRQKINGIGIHYYKNGDIVKGEFKNGTLNGFGVFIYNDKSYYEGEFMNAQKYGMGTLYYIDQDRHECQFKDDLAEGYGNYYYNNGSRFEGMYKNGVQHGKGILYTVQGHQVEIQYRGGQRI